MTKLLGIVVLFGAAWLMVRLQAGSGSCCSGKGKTPCGPLHDVDDDAESDRNRSGAGL